MWLACCFDVGERITDVQERFAGDYILKCQCHPEYDQYIYDNRYLGRVHGATSACGLPGHLHFSVQSICTFNVEEKDV